MKTAAILFRPLVVCENAGGSGLYYVVIEHQSKPEELMAFRMMPIPLRRCKTILMQVIKSFHWDPDAVLSWLQKPLSIFTLLADEFAEPAIARKIYSSAFPLGILPWCRMTRLCNIAKWRCWVNSETYSSARSVGISRPNCLLLVTGNTNDRQLKALFNYVYKRGMPSVSVHLLVR